MTDNDKYLVPPVTRAISLLRHIAAGNPCRNLSVTAKALGINRTTLIRLIHTLSQETLIEPLENEAGYRLGSGLIALAADAIGNRDIVQVARPVLQRLVRELNLSAHLGVLDGHEVVYLARQSPNTHLVSNVREGTRLPAHATTMGRILLAQLPPEQLRELYAGVTLQAYSDATPTTIDALIDQLAEVGAQGIVWSLSKFEPGIGSCACAVYDHTGQIAGAINVTGPEAAFDPLDTAGLARIEQSLRAAALAVSTGLGYRAP